MDRMKDQLDKSTAAAGKEAESNRKLQAELASVEKEMGESLAKANAEIQRRENTLLGLQKQNQQLENGKIELLRVAEAKDKEIAALQEKVFTLTANAEKEIKPRPFPASPNWNPPSRRRSMSFRKAWLLLGRMQTVRRRRWRSKPMPWLLRRRTS